MFSTHFKFHVIIKDMINLELHEAQLFRLLTSCFGNDRVIYNMSLRALCPNGQVHHNGDSSWASSYKCLFAITDEGDTPRLVVDFAPGFDGVIDAAHANKRDEAKSILNSKGIHYIGITKEEFHEIQNPEANFGLFQLLELKVEKGDITLEGL